MYVLYVCIKMGYTSVINLTSQGSKINQNLAEKEASSQMSASFFHLQHSVIYVSLPKSLVQSLQQYTQTVLISLQIADIELIDCVFFCREKIE